MVIPFRSRRAHHKACTGLRGQCDYCGRTNPCNHPRCPNRVEWQEIPRAGLARGPAGVATLEAIEARAEFFFWDRFVRELRDFENTDGGGRAVRMAEEKRAAAFVRLEKK